MSTLWTPSTNKEVNDLTMKIEVNTFEIRKVENKIEAAKQQLEHAKGYRDSMSESIKHLRSKEARIISLSEYQNILDDLNKVKLVVNDCESFIATQRNQISVLKKEIDVMRIRLDDLKNYKAKILEFKRG